MTKDFSYNSQIYKTTNYDQFKRLLGNRDVKSSRVNIIKDSIEQFGYISNPIIVNEKMEVIDGQGRLAALQLLQMPVEYRIVNGIGITECRAMNLKPTSWTNNDYIQSYAEFGNQNYCRLLKICQDYGFTAQLVLSIIKSSMFGLSGKGSELIKSGELSFTEDEYKVTDEVCKYVSQFTEIATKIGGRSHLLLAILAWAYTLPGVDRDRLKVVIHERYTDILPVANTHETLRQISQVYNRNLTKNKRIAFDYEYVTRG